MGLVDFRKILESLNINHPLKGSVQKKVFTFFEHYLHP